MISGDGFDTMSDTWIFLKMSSDILKAVLMQRSSYVLCCCWIETRQSTESSMALNMSKHSDAVGRLATLSLCHGLSKLVSFRFISDHKQPPMRSATSCGHSSGMRGARMRPLMGVSPVQISQSRTPYEYMSAEEEHFMLRITSGAHLVSKIARSASESRVWANEQSASARRSRSIPTSSTSRRLP